jgi:hypothetical protein
LCVYVKQAYKNKNVFSLSPHLLFTRPFVLTLFMQSRLLYYQQFAYFYGTLHKNKHICPTLFLYLMVQEISFL